MTQPNHIVPARRLIAAGFTRRLPGRIITVRATQAGVTGTITPSSPQAQTFDDDSDDVCPVCEQWTCRCGTSRTAAVEAVAAR